MSAEAYKDHNPGSNKGKVHKVFDEKGRDAAIKKAESLELSPNTARTWCSQWAGMKGKKKAAAPKTSARRVVKASAKKSAPAKKKPAREKLAA